VTRLVLVAVLSAVGCGPLLAHGGPVRDQVSFIDNLRERGFVVEPIGETGVIPFDVRATGLAVSGRDIAGRASLLSFNYDDTDLGRNGARVAEEDAAQVAGGTRVQVTSSAVPLPSGPTHFYRKERVIVMYIGQDAAMLRVLVELFGPQFAGARE
jgi:hypothetical protein